MQKREAKTTMKMWIKPKVRRLAAGAARFGAEGQEDGDGFS